MSSNGIVYGPRSEVFPGLRTTYFRRDDSHKWCVWLTPYSKATASGHEIVVNTIMANKTEADIRIQCGSPSGEGSSQSTSQPDMSTEPSTMTPTSKVSKLSEYEAVIEAAEGYLPIFKDDMRGQLEKKIDSHDMTAAWLEETAKTIHDLLDLVQTVSNAMDQEYDSKYGQDSWKKVDYDSQPRFWSVDRAQTLTQNIGKLYEMLPVQPEAAP